jgi:hypothetical protein
MKTFLKYTTISIVLIFAGVGFIFTAVFIGMRFGAFNVRGSIAERNSFFESKDAGTLPCTDDVVVCQWNGTPEWQAISGGLRKDADIINRVATETGVPARMIAAVVVPEQTRFFTANREIFKQYFEPLKILGSLTQFSLGISGIKEETARAIEAHANDATSPFYPGPGMAALVAYPKNTPDTDAVLYNRLTDAKNHYYAYLYTALFIKEIEAQWQHAGFSISDNPGAIVTLFNLGFSKSEPKSDPVIAGAPITSGGRTYVYGELGRLFYTSNELLDIFPRVQ